MERDLAGVQLSEDSFVRLARACCYDTKFPPSYEAWAALVAAGTQTAIAEGRLVKDVELEVDDFLGWCQRLEVVACLDALRAYLIVKRRSDTLPVQTSEPRRVTPAPRRRGRRSSSARSAWRLPARPHLPHAASL